jgi:hypothetical protein
MEHKIKTYEDACKLLKVDPKKLPVVTDLPKEFQKDLVAKYKLMIIINAVNKIAKWKIDFSDHSQWKFYPWFRVKADKKNPTGSGLSYGDYGTANAYTYVGSRLCVGTPEEAEYLGTQFEDLYKDMLL